MNVNVRITRTKTRDSFFNQPKRFFFDDPYTLAEDALRRFPNEARDIIAAADNAVAGRFVFNLPKELERTDEPVVFEGDIDWLHQPKDDPEWVYAFNRMYVWMALGQAYAITRKEIYAETFARQLKHWVRTVRRDDPACAKAWRSIEAGFRLEYWQKAMGCFAASPAVDDEIVGLFVDSVTEQAEFLMGVWNDYNIISNWGIIANHGLFMAGVMLPETARTREYTAEAVRRLDMEIRMQVFRDGTHWEQSPMYHNEVLHCLLDVLLLAERNNIPLTEALYAKTRDMCLCSLYSAKPDHNELARGDSDEISFRDLLTKGALIFGDAALRFGGHPEPDYETLWDIGEEGVRRLAEIAPEAPKSADKAFLDGGSFYFRSGWGAEDTFLHFYCGTLGAGHSHADKLHLDIFSRGEDVLVDAGRFTYVDGSDRAYFKSQRAHNTINLADSGREVYAYRNSWTTENLTRGVNQRFYADDRCGYAEGGHTGYTGEGVSLNRRVIYLKPDIIVIADECYAGDEDTHTYNQFFRFNNAGELEGGGDRYVYCGKNIRAEMVFAAPGLNTAMENSRISRHYNHYEPSRGVVTEQKARGFASIYTVIALSDPGDKSRLTVEKLPVSSNSKGITFPEDTLEALEITRGRRHYVLTIAHKEYACPTDTFNAGGCVGFGNAVVFDRAAGETHIGTVLVY